MLYRTSLLALVFLISACSGKPYQYTPISNQEVPATISGGFVVTDKSLNPDLINGASDFFGGTPNAAYVTIREINGGEASSKDIASAWLDPLIGASKNTLNSVRKVYNITPGKTKIRARVTKTGVNNISLVSKDLEIDFIAEPGKNYAFSGFGSTFGLELYIKDNEGKIVYKNQLALRFGAY